LKETFLDKSKFMELQFVTLREEIRETKARIFYIMGIGLFVVPGGEYLSRTMGAPVVQVILPILVVCVGLFYLSENHALMRCGRYIRQQIETNVEGAMGWEQWLESKDSCNPRSVDRYVSYAFYLLISVYYLASSIGAYIASSKWTSAPSWLPHALAGFYAGLGVCFLWLLVANIRSTTSTRLELHSSPK